jgi:hypothetical protein
MDEASSSNNSVRIQDKPNVGSREASITMTTTPKRLQALLSQQVERTRRRWCDQLISGWESNCNNEIVNLLKNIRPHVIAGK